MWKARANEVVDKVAEFSPNNPCLGLDWRKTGYELYDE
jgi:hypothetical protein